MITAIALTELSLWWPAGYTRPPGWLVFLAVVLVLFPLSRLHSLRPSTKSAHSIFLVVILALLLITFANEIHERTRIVPEWDYLAFWLYGKVAAQGQDFYLPQNYHQAMSGMTYSKDFQDEILDVGMRYLPPTIFMFLPLGWMDQGTGLAYWYALQLLALAAAIWLLWKEFMPALGWAGLAACASLTLLFWPTHMSFHVAQTIPMLLLFALLFWRHRTRGVSGIWIIAGFFVKPILGILFLFSVWKRQWKAMLFAALALLAAVVATIAVFGLRPFASYGSHGPLDRFALKLYVQTVNQSLFSWVLRLTRDNLDRPVSFFNPVFVTLALLLLGITVWLLYRARKSTQDDVELALLLPLGLLLYPNTLNSYAMLLLVPMMVIWKKRDILPGGEYIAVFYIASTFGLIGQSPKTYFLAFAMNWVAMAALSYWFHRPKSDPATGF